jgi:hypothetical protein
MKEKDDHVHGFVSQDICGCGRGRLVEAVDE